MFLRIGMVSMALAFTAASVAGAQASPNVPLIAITPAAAPTPQLTRFGVGPSVESGMAAARRPAVSPSLDVNRADTDSPHVGRDAAIMIVGGAGFLVGAIIGGQSGTVFMVAGGLVFLYGLYLYLQ